MCSCVHRCVYLCPTLCYPRLSFVQFLWGSSNIFSSDNGHLRGQEVRFELHLLLISIRPALWNTGSVCLHACLEMSNSNDCFCLHLWTIGASVPWMVWGTPSCLSVPCTHSALSWFQQRRENTTPLNSEATQEWEEPRGGGVLLGFVFFIALLSFRSRQLSNLTLQL